GPRRATISPGAIETSTPRTACTEPNDLASPSSWIPGSVRPGSVMAAKSMADGDRRRAAAGDLVGGARRRYRSGGARKREAAWTVNRTDERQSPPTWPPAEDWGTA